MSYLNRTQDPRHRATAMIAVGAVHAALAFGLVSGLAVDFVQHLPTPLTAIDVPLETPDPEPSDPPPPEPEPFVQFPTAPLPPIELPPAEAPIRDVLDPTNEAEKTSYLPLPRPTPQPGPSAPGLTPKRATPRNNGWIDDSDYPRRAIIDGAEGTVAFRLEIGTNGRVSSCELTRPSGHRALDDATCRLISRRAQFDPATDETGARVPGTYTGSVRWELPD
jgi:protein TonB